MDSFIFWPVLGLLLMVAIYNPGRRVEQRRNRIFRKYMRETKNV